MSAHTPGPWHVSKSHNFVRHTLADLTAANVCDLTNGSAIADDERTANARLIAAAPDLLEIVCALVAWWDENDGQTGPHAGSMFDETRTWNDVAHDARAKARTYRNANE